MLGYTIIFGLVIMSIGFVLFLGFDSLEDMRDAEQATNAERAFDVFADNMADIYQENSPSRATEIDLGDGQILFPNRITINVSVRDGGTLETHEYRVQPIEFRVTSDSSLVYEGGGVFRDTTDGGLVLQQPPLVASDSRVHVPIVQTTTDAGQSIGGTTVLVRGKSTDRSVLVADTTDTYDAVYVNVTSPRYGFWEEYLAGSTGLSDCETDDDGEWVECRDDDLDDAIVFVTRQEIEMELIP